MTTCGYVHVSDVEQNDARQLQAVSGRAQTFTNEASGKNTNCAAFQEGFKESRSQATAF